MCLRCGLESPVVYGGRFSFRLRDGSSGRADAALVCCVFTEGSAILKDHLESGKRKVIEAVAAAGMYKILDFEEENGFRNQQ